MKRSKLAILSAAMMLVIAGCGPATSETPSTPDSTPTQQADGLTRKQADDLVATFKDKVSGTFKVTYTADYKLDVVTESASAKAFARTIKDVTTMEGDFTEGNYYFHAKRVGRNLLTETEDKTTEALVYKDGDTYKYVEHNMGEVATLENEAAAIAKIAELMKKVSNREGGYVTPDTLVYNEINTYEHSQFLLDSKTVTVEEWFDDPVSMKKTDGNGIEVKSELPYVAYQTDGGVSELGGEPAANTTVVTNDKGYVTNYSIAYNDAQLAMPIMNPAPVLHLTGSRTLAATYGDTLTKLDEIDHHATTGMITLPSASTKGYAEVFTCAPGQFTKMSEVKANTEYPVGDWLCIKVTPASGNTVLNVSYANSSTTLTDPATAGGYYCFAIKEGNNSVAINYEGSASLPTETTVTVELDDHATLVENHQVTTSVGEIVTFTLAGQNAANWGVATAEGKVPVGADKWAGIKVEADEGYEIDKVTVNGQEAKFIAGYYCVNTKLPKSYEYEVTTKEAAAPVEQHAIIVVEENPSVASIKVETFTMPDTNTRVEVQSGDEIPFGENKWVAVQVTPVEGKTVESVMLNDKAFANYGMLCASVATAGTYTIKVNIAGETAVETATLAVMPNSNVESVVVETFTYPQFNARTAVESGATIPFGSDKWIAVVATPKHGYEVESITVNGVKTQNYNMECIKIEKAGTYTVEVTVKEMTKAILNVKSNANVESIKVETFTYPDTQNLTVVESGAELPIGDSKWIAVTVTPKEGYTVTAIKVNGQPLQNYGMYCVAIKTVGTYTVEVEVAPAA